MIVERDFEFGRTLKSVRESRGMMQKDLGDRAGIDPNRISNWELGYSLPQLAAFRAICIALNCPPGDLLGIDSSDLSADEYKMLQAYRALDDAGHDAAWAVIESQLRRIGKSDG